MSSESGSSCNQQHQLPTTTTFLPILDDLLSPDFRPVTYPPVITPLQTPTTVVPTASCSTKLTNGVRGAKNETVAAAKIQKWWKNNSNRRLSLGHDDGDHVRHSVRHRRAEEHIRALETEVTRLKSSLATERKLRSLQYEAIRSLWSQVQKLTVNNADTSTTTIMTQSLPNGLETGMISQPAQAIVVPSCGCSSAVEKLESEISELRALILESVVAGRDGSTSEVQECSSKVVNKRPDSLDLNGGASGCSKGSAKPEELQGYANDMAKFVVERGISDNVDGGK